MTRISSLFVYIALRLITKALLSSYFACESVIVDFRLHSKLIISFLSILVIAKVRCVSFNNNYRFCVTVTNSTLKGVLNHSLFYSL